MVSIIWAMDRINCCDWSKQKCLAGEFDFYVGYSVDVDAMPVVVFILRRIGEEMLNSFVMKSIEDCIKKHSRKN